MPEDAMVETLRRMIGNVEERIAGALDTIQRKDAWLVELREELDGYRQQLKKHLDSPDNSG